MLDSRPAARPARQRWAVRDASGQDVQEEVGELWVRPPIPTTEVGAMARLDGWIRTGELARTDGVGTLRYVARSSGIATIGGRKVTLIEIEEAPLQHTAALDACVTVVNRDTETEAIAAIVAPVDAVDAKTLRKLLVSQISSHKVPRKFFFVERVPRGPLGKPIATEIASIIGRGGENKPNLPRPFT